MTGTQFTIAAWVLIALAIVLSLSATARRNYTVTAEERDGIIRMRRYAVWAAGFAVACAVIGLLEPLPAGGGDRPVPQPTPSCAHLVDFPDAVPPRYGVCVPVEEAG